MTCRNMAGARLGSYVVPWQSASPQRNPASWHHFGQIRSTFPHSPKVLLSAMHCRKEYGLPRRFAPRNDRGGTSLHPRTPVRLQHVIANQCAHWCGNPFSPQGSLTSWCYFRQIRMRFFVFAGSTALRHALPQGLRIATSLRSSQ